MTAEIQKLKTFRDLKFEKHPGGNGIQALEFFDNGYGISAIRFRLPALEAFPALEKAFGRKYGSYTNDETEFECAVLIGSEAEWHITYETPITEDILGYLKEDDVTNLMENIQKLPPASEA